MQRRARAAQGVDRDAAGRPTTTRSASASSQDYDEDNGTIEDVGWRTYYLFSKAEITGDMLRDAQARARSAGPAALGGWYVRIDVHPRWRRPLRRDHRREHQAPLRDHPRRHGRLGAGHPDRRSPAATRRSRMGAGDPEQQLDDARKLELVLRSGALPAPISPSNEQRIGPSLGHDAIAQGVKGALAGIALVLVFMVVYYRRAGVVANIAVLFNLLLQLAILALFGASMTLPGIAGLALTIGMAVDANVLINERIREELRARQEPARGGRRGLRQGVQRHPRRPRHHVHLRPHPRAVRHRAPSRASPSRSSSASSPACSPASSARASCSTGGSAARKVKNLHLG